MDLLQEHIFCRDKSVSLTQAEMDEACEDIELIATNPEKAKALVPEALALVRAVPKAYKPQLLAATLLERAQQRENMLDTWAGLHDRFPDVHIALRYLVRWLNRDGQVEDAVFLLDGMIEQNDGNYRSSDLAELCSEIRDPQSAVALFEQLIETDPSNVRLRVIYGKYLFSKGDVYRAFSILDPLREERLSPTARQIVEKTDRANSAMKTLQKDETAKASVLTNALSIFKTRVPREIENDRIAGISFYTGSLGAGGAERQLTQMASAFHHRKRVGRNIHGTQIDGIVEVIVNNVDRERGKDFFAPALKASGVPLTVTSQMPKQPLERIAPDRPELTEIMPLLPRNVRYGLERLVAHFRAKNPDVAYFWQDGSVLTGALAALIAGVPRIAISLRGLPPNLRPHMMKPEYLDLYTALAQIPGVTFSCNSRSAADAYAAWLDLPPERFSVIYNAVREMPVDTDQNEERRWSIFERETEGATFTLGGIFRFDPNKRGLLWLEFAKAALDSHSGLRFVIVGEGEEMAAAQAKAALLGIEQRCLFVGSSKTPGFWLDKMDATLMLSRHEGLPNVLIEAQMSRVPVISTPAGGASETFHHGKTGFLLSSAKEPSKDEFMLYLNRLINEPEKRIEMGEHARAQAMLKFERETVFAQTIRHFHGEHIEGDKERGDAAKVRRLEAADHKTGFDPRVQAAYNVLAEL